MDYSFMFWCQSVYFLYKSIYEVTAKYNKNREAEHLRKN